MASDVIFAGDLPRQTISDRLRRGEIRRLARGVYTSELELSADELVRRRWPVIIGRLLPAAVVTDRSAPTGGTVAGYVYLAHAGRDRIIELPGLTALARRGAGPLNDDVAMPGGLFQAARGRGLAENTRASRRRGERPRRTLDDSELADWIVRLCRIDGEQRLAQYRQDAEAIAQLVGAPTDGMERLFDLIGAALGTRQVASGSRALTARQHRRPFDSDGIQRLNLLAAALSTARPQSRRALEPGTTAYDAQAFFEAYFSNYIEGTTFTVDEAQNIVDGGTPPPRRSADAHDILGTYRIVADGTEMSRVADSADGFVELLRERHAMLMGGRSEAQPGTFKDRPNQAGASIFVAPELVVGTLRQAFERLDEFDTAWERAVYQLFLVSEVHPFTDGNGRIARVMMNAELVHGRQCRIVVPTGYRDDYLGALRRLTRSDDPTVLLKAMRFAQDYTFEIDWSTRVRAETDLRRTNAFAEGDDGEPLRLMSEVGRRS